MHSFSGGSLVCCRSRLTMGVARTPESSRSWQRLTTSGFPDEQRFAQETHCARMPQSHNCRRLLVLRRPTPTKLPCEEFHAQQSSSPATSKCTPSSFRLCAWISGNSWGGAYCVIWNPMPFGLREQINRVLARILRHYLAHHLSLKVRAHGGQCTRPGSLAKCLEQPRANVSTAEVEAYLTDQPVSSNPAVSSPCGSFSSTIPTPRTAEIKILQKMQRSP